MSLWELNTRLCAPTAGSYHGRGSEGNVPRILQFRRCLVSKRKHVLSKYWLPVEKVRAVTSGVQNLLQLSPQRELGFPTAVPM
jgi:hypothetical protein